MSLFKPAEEQANRLKVFIYGKTGVGKTVTALQFPNPVVFDTEKGTNFYGGLTKFYRIQTNKLSEVHAGLDELLENPQGFKTLVFDSMTKMYDDILGEIESKMKIKTGKSDYVIQLSDYKVAKAKIKSIIRKLLALDMNIICIAHSKALYDKDEVMKVIGTQADAPDTIPYIFDTFIELYIDKDGKRMAKVYKDRSNCLPKEFEFSYQIFTKYLDMKELEREPIVFKQKAALEEDSGRKTVIKIKGKEVKTAGITSETLGEILKVSKTVGEEKIKTKLMDDFSISSLLDLNEDEGKLFLQDLTTEE